MSIRSDLSIRTVALGTSRKNLRTLNQNLHLRRPNVWGAPQARTFSEIRDLQKSSWEMQ